MLRGFFLLAGILFAMQARAVPDKDLWTFWDAEQKESTQVIDHSLWQVFLDKYLKFSSEDGMHLMNYAGVKKVDRDMLQKYINSLAVTDPRELNRNEQLAYWINLYNALTVNLILKYYPVKSITKLGKGWFRMGPWKDTMVSINGRDISLHDIEHRILRPIWKNPKIHYALNCASIGCPDLAPKVYTSTGIDYQLVKAGDQFVNQQKGVNFVAGRIVLSRLFEWYEDDFGEEDGVQKELLEHANAPLKEKIRNYRGRISYHYNWQLNEYKSAPAK